MTGLTQNSDTEVSIVIPCLNEADTLETSLKRAQIALRNCTESGEIIVADNGSSDNSAEIASRNGARVVKVEERGYGSALMGGIAAAKGKYIVMGDADESHDLSETPRFIEKLREGYDLAQGCRLPSGGGTITEGSMSFLHRHLGNPFFSFLVRRWFHSPLHDVYCGFRAFTKDFYYSLDQRCTGMEFAPEMLIKASFLKAKIVEVPITHHPDGRVSQPAHLRTFRDGWRTLRFFLMFCPRWLFLVPGIFLVLVGSITFVLSTFNFFRSATEIQIQISILASLAILCGYQSILFAIFTKVFAISEGLLPADPRFDRFFEVINLERGLTFASITLLSGSAFLILGIFHFKPASIEPMNLVFLGATMVAVSFQTVLSGFFTSILGMKRKRS